MRRARHETRARLALEAVLAAALLGLPYVASATPIVTAPKVDVLINDIGGDGMVNPGDTLQYQITLDNSGDMDAVDVLFLDTPDAHTSLAVGSVTTSQGAITSGNTAGDTTVSVAVGTLAALGSSVLITFDVSVLPGAVLPALGVGEVNNQGIVSGSNIADLLTDDPAVGGSQDPTSTPVVPEPGVSLLVGLGTLVGCRRR